MKTNARRGAAVIAAVIALLASPPAAGTDFSGAGAIFARFAAVCEAEGGALWGLSLCGPILLVDPASRALAASVQDSGGTLRREGAIFAGTLPPAVTVANTSADWSGTRWTMLMWPLPKEEAARLVLLAHESYHRLQPALRFEPRETDNAHLDSMEGRTWLLLEARALDRALAARGDPRRAAVADALRFRAKRHELIPAAAASESALEANEGLAEYTGVAVGAPAAGVEPGAWARRGLAGIETRASLVRSFAYGTGPAYGVLLDEAKLSWRERALRGAPLPTLAAEAFGLDAIDPSVAEDRAHEYGYADVAVAERRREEERQARLADFRATLVDGPVLIVPLGGGKIMFDPNRVYPFGEEGTVYGVFTASGPWGEISATGKALVAADWSTLRVAGPPREDDAGISGEGWTLKLNPGWKLAPGNREEDSILVRAADEAGASHGGREAQVVSPAWLAEHLGERDLVLLHVGETEGYEEKHLPGARLVSLSDISLSGESANGLRLEMPPADDLRVRLETLGISDGSRIVVYYGKDWISPSTRVLFTLEYAGLGGSASLLDGGMDAWIAAGYEVTAAVPPPAEGTLSPLTVRPVIVDAAYVRENVGTPGISVIDARDPAFYDGTRTGGSVEKPHRPGHIAGARSVPFSEIADDALKLRSGAELRALFARAGVQPGDTVVAYCHIGQQATAVLFAARTLGHPVLLYDGSFEEWSRQPGAPVENPAAK